MKTQKELEKQISKLMTENKLLMESNSEQEEDDEVHVCTGKQWIVELSNRAGSTLTRT